jgi:hypothetical protein
MALTLDLINAQEGLSGLTDEQKTALVGLSERDEETTFNRRFGETLGQMDTVIASEGAIGRNEGEKTSEYMARVIRTLKSSADEGAGYKTANETLNAEVERLKKQIESGAADAELKQRVAKLEGDLTSAKKINADLQESLTKSAAEYKGKLEGYRMESEIGAAMTGIVLKKELPEATKQALMTLAKQNVMAAKHVFDETAGVFIFQDADGNPMKDKSLNNLTVADMLRVQLETMGVLDTGRQQGGAGGNGGNGGGGGAAVNLSLARTKVEADEMIEKQLMSQGHAKSDPDWYERFSEARKANKALLDTLPLN